MGSQHKLGVVPLFKTPRLVVQIKRDMPADRTWAFKGFPTVICYHFERSGLTSGGLLDQHGVLAESVPGHSVHSLKVTVPRSQRRLSALPRMSDLSPACTRCVFQGPMPRPRRSADTPGITLARRGTLTPRGAHGDICLLLRANANIGNAISRPSEGYVEDGSLDRVSRH